MLRMGGALLGMDDWKERGVSGVWASGLGAVDAPLDQASAHAGRDGLEGKRGLGRGVGGKVWVIFYRSQS
jgi:hypothetical protein